MLVVSRRRDEGVTIGPDVRVVVLGIKAGVVSLGIEAPPQIVVHRDEVYAKVQAQNRLAAEAGAIPLNAFSLLKKPTVPTTDATGTGA
jgi:carbon storage regulator